MDIRHFIQQDRTSLRVIYLASRKYAFDWLDSSRFKLNDFDRDTEAEKIWVCAENNNPVGFISVLVSEKFIHHLFVHPSSMGRGIGSALLSACLNEIGRPVSLKCLEKNSRANKFYHSRGWKNISYGNSADGRYQLMQFDD